jgi:ribosomal protein S12 methylthiotransferase
MDLITPRNKKVHLISLGCARNRVDSEVMLGSLIQDHWSVVDSADGVDAVVINTCAVSSIQQKRRVFRLF